jgi:hypothetical protein
MLRAMEPLEQEVKKIDIRRDREGKKRELEAEIILARGAESREVKNSKR